MGFYRVDLTDKIKVNEIIETNATHSSLLKIHSLAITEITAYISEDETANKLTTKITKGVSDGTLAILDLGADDTLTVDITGYTHIAFNGVPAETEFVYLITEDR